MRMTYSNIWTRTTGWLFAESTKGSRKIPQEAQILLTGPPAYAKSLQPQLIRESPLWIKSSQDKAYNNRVSQSTCQVSQVDVMTLTPKQLFAYNIISRHHGQLLNSAEQSPIHMIICGTAGTEKSYLISAIAHTLGSACILTGTTGMAAFNICGSTVHSALKLPVHWSSHKDLQGPAFTATPGSTWQ